MNWHVLEAAKNAQVDGDVGAELAGQDNLPEAREMYAASLRVSVHKSRVLVSGGQEAAEALEPSTVCRTQ